MSETTYAKGACELCGDHIEFPAEAAGQSIACPHCGGTTALNAPVPAPRRRGALKWVVVAVICFVAAGVGIFMLKHRTPVITPRGITAQVLSFERASMNNPGAVAGVVKNAAGIPRQGVRVEVELLNTRGEPLWATTAFAPAIEPNKSWSFRASVVDPNVVTARVARVRELGR